MKCVLWSYGKQGTMAVPEQDPFSHIFITIYNEIYSLP